MMDEIRKRLFLWQPFSSRQAVWRLIIRSVIPEVGAWSVDPHELLTAAMIVGSLPRDVMRQVCDFTTSHTVGCSAAC